MRNDEQPVRPALMAIAAGLFWTLPFFVAVVCFSPNIAHGQFGAGNAICAASQCNQPKKPPCSAVACYDVTNGIKTTGVCVSSTPGNCKAVSYQGIGGDIKGVLDALKFIKDLFGKQKGGGGGGGGGTPPGSTYPPCTTNEATGTVSPIPCVGANGVVNYGGTLGTGAPNSGQGLGTGVSDALLDALGGSTNTDTTAPTTTDTAQQSTETQTQEPTQQQTDPQTPTGAVALGPGGTEGDIFIGGSGATIVARSRDPQANTEVAGFFGGGATTLTQSQSLIGRLCASRPWAGGFVAAIIPPTFFDGLCERGGYQVGLIQPTPTAAPAATKQPTVTITQPTITEPSTPAPALDPMVDIWAEPASVRLGTRTYIFWNTRDVVQCEATGPSFHHTSLSGGASTVPIGDEAEFIITCSTADGRELTDRVTVYLAI